MMNIVNYVREKGIKRVFQVLYEYKIQKILVKVCYFFTKNKPLKNIIMIESHNDFDCNGGVFYDYLLKNGYNKKYKIVWLVRKKVSNLPENVECLLLKGPGLKKAYYTCLAKYFTFDCEETEKVRDDQKMIYFTHGAVGLKKTVGLSTLSPKTDYILFPSDKMYAPVLAEQYEMEYPSEKIVHLGYPIHDVICSPSENEIKKIKIQPEKYNKIILWMPTFRKGGGFQRNDSSEYNVMGVPIIKNKKMYEELNEYLNKKNDFMIIKIHPKQDLKNLGISDKSNIKVLTGDDMKRLNIDNYRLIKDADALISDYSSIVFDYLLLNRPVGYVFADLSSYKLGLCVDNVQDYLAGPIINNYEEFIMFIEDVTNEHDRYEEKRVQLAKDIYDYADCNNCERIVQFLGI